MKIEHVFLSSRWQSPQATVAVDGVQAPDDLISMSPVPPLVFFHTTNTALCAARAAQHFDQSVCRLHLVVTPQKIPIWKTGGGKNRAESFA